MRFELILPDRLQSFPFDRCNWIKPKPADSSDQVDNSRDPESHHPVPASSMEDDAREQRTGGCGDATHHIHAAGKGSGERGSDVHAGGPAARHGEIVTETCQAHCKHRPKRIFDIKGKNEQQRGPAETDESENSTSGGKAPQALSEVRGDGAGKNCTETA